MPFWYRMDFDLQKSVPLVALAHDKDVPDNLPADKLPSYNTEHPSLGSGNGDDTHAGYDNPG